MPYCPSCKSEYREGFTMCADCACPLVEGGLPEKPEAKQPETETPGIFMQRTFLVQTADAVQTEMVRDILAQHGIVALVQERELGNYLNIYMGFSVYGEDIFVDQNDYARAAELVQTLSFLQPPKEMENLFPFEEEQAPPFWKTRRGRAWMYIILFWMIPFALSLILFGILIKPF